MQDNELQENLNPEIAQGTDDDESLVKENMYDETADITEESSGKRSGFWVRFCAFSLDSFIAGILMLATYFICRSSGYSIFKNDLFFFVSGAGVAAYIVKKLYYILTTCIFGGTFGKKVLRLHIVDTKTGEKPAVWKVIFRETIAKYLSLMTLGIGYLMVLGRKGTLHDRLSDTIVEYMN